MKHQFIQVPARCEADSLSPAEANQRLLWTMRCIPDLRKHLEGYLGKDRPYYPTFNERNETPNGDVFWTNPHAWVAPVEQDASSVRPPGYYIFSLCLGG